MRGAAASPVTELRGAFAALAALFLYPNDSGSTSFHEAESQLLRVDPGAAHAIRAFNDSVMSLDLAARQIAYTATFDLAPACSPYLGVHLFGEESPDRARLMVGLRTSYRKQRGDMGHAELPDHIAEVLAFAPHYDEDEWEDLVRLVLAPAITKMDELMRPTANPYRHLVAVVRHLAADSFTEGGRA